MQKFIKGFKQSFEVIVLKNSAKTAQEATTALGCDIGAIVKSLLIKTEDSFVLCLVSSNKRCPLNKIKKIKNNTLMVSSKKIKTQIGYTIGCLSQGSN